MEWHNMANPTYLENYEIFPYPPLTGVQETLSTKTHVLKSFNGSEQRITQQIVPRQQFQFEVYLGDEYSHSKIQASLFNWQKLYWALPIWSEATIHTGILAAGSSVVAIDTAYADYRDATLAIIWKSDTEYETVLLTTVGPASLGINGVTANTYTGTKLIMPCRLAQITDVVDSNFESSDQGRYGLEFHVFDNLLRTTYTPAITYESLEVITEPGVIMSGELAASRGDMYREDEQTGKFKLYSFSTFNEISRTYFRRYETLEDIWNYRLFLHSLYGRQKVVWLPTFRNDLQLNTGIGPADDTIVINAIGLTVNTFRNNLAFILTDGTQYYREIVGITLDSYGNEQIEIDSPLGVTIPVGGCDISFLDKCRRGSDEVLLDWASNLECNSQLDFEVVEQ